jgi:insertion element IS1 protein InsB
VPGVPRGAWGTFLLDYAHAGQSPAVKQQIVDMALNASGIRDTARVLHLSPTTVNQSVLQHRHLEQAEVERWRADALEVRRGLSSELDEMGSDVQSKANPRWLWHAIGAP